MLKRPVGLLSNWFTIIVFENIGSPWECSVVRGLRQSSMSGHSTTRSVCSQVPIRAVSSSLRLDLGRVDTLATI